MLARRRRRERLDRHVALCLDLSDVHDAALRSGLGWDRMLELAASHGATHVSLPEITLGGLLAAGRVVLRAPGSFDPTDTGVGHPLRLAGDDDLIGHLETELAIRLPQTRATRAPDGDLQLVGDLTTLGELGLGFETALAARIRSHGLRVLPRPVAYAWPEPELIRRSLTQAAAESDLVAFAGDMVLGHEMHLDVTIATMRAQPLAMVYFAESRHQKGDWFVAKRLAPRVVIGHRLSRDVLLALDGHAAAHHWCHLVRERGIRLCYVDFIRVLHATEPLAGLHYLEHVRDALQADGFVVSAEVPAPSGALPKPSPAELSALGLTAGGVAATAATAILDLPTAVAVPVALALTTAAVSTPRLDQPRTDLESAYPPSYAPKALALVLASLAPAAAVASLARATAPAAGWLGGVGLNAAAAAALAATLSGDDYRLRIEDFRGLGLDWALPLAAAVGGEPDARRRWAMLTALAAAWAAIASRRLDLLAAVDAPPAQDHTHHLSAAVRAAGDLALACGPRPARKWAGLGPLAAAAAVQLARTGRPTAARVAAAASAIGYSAALVGFRRSERALDRTVGGTLPSFGVGVAAGAALLLGGRAARRPTPRT